MGQIKDSRQEVNSKAWSSTGRLSCMQRACSGSARQQKESRGLVVDSGLPKDVHTLIPGACEVTLYGKKSREDVIKISS